MERELILVDKQDMVGLITLNRPEEMNTFNVPFARDLNDVLRNMDQDDDVRVLVIRASGKHFSTGISLSEFKDKSQKDYREFIKLMDEHNHTIARNEKACHRFGQRVCPCNRSRNLCLHVILPWLRKTLNSEPPP